MIAQDVPEEAAEEADVFLERLICPGTVCIDHGEMMWAREGVLSNESLHVDFLTD